MYAGIYGGIYLGYVCLDWIVTLSVVTLIWYGSCFQTRGLESWKLRTEV